MPSPSRRLKRAQVLRALTRLGELCIEAKLKAEVAIYGGTVMMLAYDCREATKDVDAIFQPAAALEPLIRRVAREQDLPDDWMKAGVRPFVAPREARIEFAQLRIPGLAITRPTAEYLLAMKCLAARLPKPGSRGDTADGQFLLRKLRLTSMTQIDAIVADYYGDRPLEAGKRWLIEKLPVEASHAAD